jgi:DNA-binding beta-propeller fold protein YncE
VLVTAVDLSCSDFMADSALVLHMSRATAVTAGCCGATVKAKPATRIRACRLRSPGVCTYHCFAAAAAAAVFNTDPPYGFKQNFRPEPELGARVYALNPDTGAVCLVADNFVMPNGIAFSPDFGTVYVTDTGDKDVSKRPRARLTCPFSCPSSVPAAAAAAAANGIPPSLGLAL